MLSNYIHAYIEAGLKPVPLYPRSKQPIGYKWNQDWNEITVRELFKLYPNANIGLLLGEIVDIEGDTDEANDLINRLTRNYPHPQFQSSKSIHHLFLNYDHTLTRLARRGIEFRAYLHQSVVPPSIHPKGLKYTWLVEPTIIPPVPPDLLNLYEQLKAEKSTKPKKKKTLFSCNRVCPHCGKIIKIDKKRYHLEMLAFSELGLIWLCKKCRSHDIRHLCRNIKKDMRRPK